MKTKILAATLLACASWPAAAQSLTAQHFQVNTTADLIALCSPSPSDPMASQALHFCHGYLVGAFHYHQGATAGQAQRVCLPSPVPSRDAGVAQFVSWARANPQYLQERPVDSEFRFLEATFPCRR